MHFAWYPISGAWQNATMNRAYSTIELKAVDSDRRILEGIASTPETDRVGDIVEPLGAKFKLPLPFLWQHERDKAIGHVVSAAVTKSGIKIRVEIEQDDEPGPLKDLLDMAWRSIKKGLVRGLSIGFRSIDDPEPIKGTYGLRFTNWEMLEVSSVTIPANAGATITAVKSIDAELLAALGQKQIGLDKKQRPGASGAPVKLTQPQSRGDSMNYAEKIKEYEGERGTKEAAQAKLMEDAAKEGRTLDKSEGEQYDTLESEIETLNEHISRLKKEEQKNAARAKPVDQTPSQQAAAETRTTIVTVAREEKAEPGIMFARFAMCVAAAKGSASEALRFMETHYPKHLHGIEVLKSAAMSGRSVEKHISMLGEFRTKTDVAAGTTTGTTWAAPLLAHNTFAGDFVEFLRPQTIIGKFGTGNIPSLRRIPFNVWIRGQTTGGTGYWVRQARAKPVTKFDFNEVYHGWYKVAAISVITEDLIRFSDPSAEMLVRDGLRDALVEVIDETFIDPTVPAVANTSPAAITNGATAIPSSGDTADAVRADLLDLWAEAIGANLPLSSAVYITTPSIALALSLMRTDLGNREFPDININGGVLEGVPVIVSNYVPAGTLVLAFASEIFFSDDGVVTVDASREASIQMADNPNGASDTPTAAQLVSMFQTNSVALRGERFINWSKRRDEAVAYLHGVSWGGAES